MPALKRGLSPLARAEAGLSAKQIRRSVNEQNATLSRVRKKYRDAFIPAPQPALVETEEPASEAPGEAPPQ
jgi:hypothetical protein